jgi:phage shock protein C
METSMSSHYRSKGIYRSRDGIILGVCKGIATHFDLSTFWVRVITVCMLLLSGFWPILGIYLVAALLMKVEPIQPFADENEQSFYDSYANSPGGAARRLKKRFQDLDRRIRRMEDNVTSQDFEWERKFDS